MTSDQEAVCGTCAGDPRDGSGYHAFDCPERTERIPAPVVPVPGVCDVLERDWGEDEAAVAEFCAALTRIEESQ